MLTAQTLWHIDPFSSQLIMEELAVDKGSMLETQFSMISTGTERLVAGGRVPASLREKMKVPFMKGSFDFPLAYGYSCVASDKEGKSYHLMHPHSSKIIAPSDVLFPLGNNAPLSRYALISNMETVVNAIWDAELTKGDRVAIIGGGNLGCMLALVLRDIHGIEVDVLEQVSERKELLVELGFNVEMDVLYHKVFHTSCSASSLQRAIDITDLDGRVIELSWYGSTELQLSLGENFHYNRITIRASQVSHIPPHKRDEYDFNSRKGYCASLIEQMDALDDLIHLVPFSDAVGFFERLRQGLLVRKPIFVFDYAK